MFYISSMIRRELEPQIRSFLEQFPVVGLIGPRQVGKTTLAKEIGRIVNKEVKPPVYLDLELPSDLAKLSDPELFLGSHGNDLVIIDEIQRKPEMFPLLRALVDKDKKPGRFLVLGSANLPTLRGISESLAGRIAYLELTTFLRSEIGNNVDIKKHWLLGGYPDAILSKDDASAFKWLGALIRSYLERDLPLLGFRIPSLELRRFWTMLAHSHGGLWNAQKLAASFGVTPPTMTHYRSILEQMFLVRTIYPWHSNIGKRLVKSPAVYIGDSGILHSLLGIEDYDGLLSHPIAGKSWEGFVIEQIIGSLKGGISASFFKTHAGAEMDLVLHKGQRVLAAIEIKLGLAPKVGKGFHNARKDLGNPPSWIIYSGDERYQIDTGVEVIGLDDFINSILPNLP